MLLSHSLSRILNYIRLNVLSANVVLVSISLLSNGTANLTGKTEKEKLSNIIGQHVISTCTNLHSKLRNHAISLKYIVYYKASFVKYIKHHTYL